MGKKTHGPYLIQAIEKNDHQKVHEILSKEIRNKEKIREICVSSLKRLASEHCEVPLLLAAQLPDPSIIQYMVGNHHVDINFVWKEVVGRKQKVKTALIMAVRRGMYDTVEAILAMNADPNIQDHKGRSPLHHAVRKADYRMAKMLVVRGAQASLTDKGDNTPLHVASIFGHVELAKMLIYYGADLYKKGQLGAIPIHIAAKEGHVGLIRLFCQHDVNPNIKMPCYDGREKAAVHVAAEEGHFECVIVLVELGADINLGDSEGESPLHCAVLHEYDPMGMKSKEDYTETLKTIVKNGGNVNQQNGRGETALHLAARNQFQKSVEVLLQCGADPLIEDNSGDKPIDLVDEDDAVSRQILKQVMENREQYMNDLFEMKAKGYSTSANPLPSKSVSMDMLSSKDSFLGKAVSTLGLVHYPKPSVSSLPAEDEYLQPLGSRNNVTSHSVTAEINLIGSDQEGNKQHQPDSTYAKIDESQQNQKPTPQEQEVNKAKPTPLQPKFLKGRQSQESLLERKAAMLESSDSSHYDDESKYKRNAPNKITKPTTNGVIQIEAVKRSDSNIGRSLPSPPQSAIRDSIISTSTDMTDMSSVWDVTPHPSVSGPHHGQRDFGVSKTTGDLMSKLKQDLASRQRVYSDYTTTQYETLPDEEKTRELKGLSTFTPEPKVKQIQPPPTQAPKTGTKIVYAENQHSESDDDTFFDDESFDTMDTMSEATVEMVDKQKQKIQTANKELYSAKDVATKKQEGGSHMQNWLSEQATLMINRNFEKGGGPIAQSTPPSSRVNYNSTNTLDTPSDMYENFTSVSEQAARNRQNRGEPSSKIPKVAGRPVPPPRPPKKLERNPSTSSTDSLRRPQPPEPKVKKKGRNKSESEESSANFVHLEVDDKEPGQTVIRILPVKQSKPAVPKKKPQLSKDNLSNFHMSSKQPSSFDTESEISTYSKGGSKVKRKPSQRIVVDRSGVSRQADNRRNFISSANRFVPVNADKSEEESFEHESIFLEQSDDEEPNTGHYNVRYFENVKQQEYEIKEDVITQQLPSSPTTPKIKMTFQSKKPEETITAVNKQVSKPTELKPKPQVTAKPIVDSHSANVESRPVIRPKPQPRNLPPALNLDDKIQTVQPAAAKSPVPKPRPQNEISVSSSHTSSSLDTMTSSPRAKSRDTTPSVSSPKVKNREMIPNSVSGTPKVTTQDKVPKSPKVKTKKVKETVEEKVSNVSHGKKKKKARQDDSGVLNVSTQDTQSESGQEHDINQGKTKPQQHNVVKVKVTESQPPAMVQTAAQPVAKTEQQQNIINTNNNEEDSDKITPTKKKVKKKRTKVKDKEQTVAAKTATIKIEKVEKPEEKEEVVKKPDIPHYAVVNKEAKDKTKLKPSVAEDMDDISYNSSQDSKEPPSPPVKLIDPYPVQVGSKPPQMVKLEDPYATVSVVDEIMNKKSERLQSVGANHQYDTDPGYEAPPPVPQSSPPVSPSAVQMEKSPKTRKVTIGSRQFIPNHKKKPKDHDHRKIVYICGGQIDFDIIGGNADGVFVYNVVPGSNAENAGLQIGDKILKVNEDSVLGKTKEEVYIMLKITKNILDMVVKHKYNRYKALIDSGGLGDSFHIRAHIEYKAQKPGEMHVTPGDIFLVQDTLPNGQSGQWRAKKINAGPREQQHGLIPNLQKAEQFALDVRMTQLKEFEKEKGGFLKRGFRRSKSLDRAALKLGKSQEDLSLNARNKIAYERMEHKPADFPRPVMLLGLFCDKVRDMLARECPGLFHIPPGDIEVPTTSEKQHMIEPVNIATIKSIIASNKHCLTIISPNGIEYLRKSDLNPMVIYLSPGNKNTLKSVKNVLAPTLQKKVGYLYEESQGFEKMYDHLFTATVSYTSDDSWFTLLKDTIHRIQNQPQWQAVKETAKPQNRDSDALESDEEDDGYEENVLNRSLDNIPGQINSNIMNTRRLPSVGISPAANTNSPTNTSLTGSLTNKNSPKKSILKNNSRSDLSPNTSHNVSDTESSSSSLSRTPMTNHRPQPHGQYLAPPNQHYAEPNLVTSQHPTSTTQYHQQLPPATQYSQPPSGNQRLPSQSQQQPADQGGMLGVHPGLAAAGFHPAMQSFSHTQPVQPPSSKETVL